MILGTLAASWRSECVYYLAAIPVLLALLCARRLLRPLTAGAVTALVLVGYFACSRYSSALMGEAWQYKMIALCYQTAALVQDADPVEDAEALADIDRVFDVEFCRANPETHGNELRGDDRRARRLGGGLVGLPEGHYKAGPQVSQEHAAGACGCVLQHAAPAPERPV